MTGFVEKLTANVNDSNPFDVTQDHQGNPIPRGEGTPSEHPSRIGRYRTEKVLTP